MKSTIAVSIALLLLTFVSHAQTLSNEAIQGRIRSARAEKDIVLTFDAAAGSSKLLAVSDNFAKHETSRSGILAMNFAIGHIYAGDALTKEPGSFLLAFWVMAKRPRFGVNHALTIALRDEMLVIGSARYVAKARDGMEYLNFEISRENLARIAAQTDVRFMLGNEEFTFTPSQMKLLADLLTVTELREG